MPNIDLAPFEEAFKEISGGDDKIDANDLKKALEKGGAKVTDEDVAQIMAVADVEGTGYINFEEFVRAVIGVNLIRMILAELQRIFAAIDTDGSGYITKQDLEKAWEKSESKDKIPKEKIDDIVKKCDQSGDGKITFEEFAQGVRQAILERNK